MKKIILSIVCFILIFSSRESYATHAAGIDLTYECISNNQYRITLRFFRECSGIPAPAQWDGLGGGGYINLSNGIGYDQDFSLNSITPNPVPVYPQISSSPTCPYTGSCSGGTTNQTQVYTYQGVITLPYVRNDWTITAAMGNRNGSITTVNNADNYTICVQATINNTNFYCNNSPTWNSFPPGYLCVNTNTNYSVAASDIDGDSLVYTLYNPLDNSAGWAGYSNNVNNVPYNGGFNFTNPFNGTMTFNPQSGNMSFFPTSQLTTIWAVRVDEYRNGILIGSIARDIQSVILACNSNPPNLTGIDVLTVADPNSSSFSFCANGASVINFDINALTSPPASSTNITMTLGPTNLPPNATFTIVNNGTNNPIMTFNWVPQYADLLNSPFWFTLDLIDDACISNTASYTYQIDLTSSSGFIFSDITTDVSCPGLVDGAIDITVSGPSGVPTFDWTGPNGFIANTEDVSNLDTGQYTVIVTDANGCTSSQVYNVSQNSVSLLETHTDPSCFTYNDGSIDLSVVSGIFPYTYSWVGPNGYNSSQEDPINLLDGTYTVTVTDAVACSTDLSVLITEPSALSINGSVTSDYNGQDVSCYGESDAQITASVFGGTPPYSYSIDSIVFSSNPVVSNLPAGVQSIFYRDSKGCFTSENITISEPTPLTLVVDNFSDISCFGAADASIAISVSGGTQTLGSYNFLWSSPSNGFTSSSEDLASLTQSGTYYCTVTDANFCAIYSPPINITEPAEITKNINFQDISCFGASDGTISLVINGGNAPYTVDWTGPSTIPQQNTIPYFLNQLDPGNYNFTITDSKGCTDAANPSIVLVQPADITISVINGPVTCYEGSDGSLDLSVSNIINPSFVWTSNDPNFYETTEDIFSLQQGVYSVIVTDAITGCTKSLSESVQIITPYDVVSFKNDETCFDVNDGSINIVTNSSASYSYNWIYPDASTSTSQNVSNGVPGNYQLTINYTQANASGVPILCAVDENFFIMPAPEILVSASLSSVSCEGGNDGSIGLSVSGGTPFLNNSYSYLWSNMQTTKDIANLPTGLYSVTILDQNNCSLDTSFTLNSLTFDTTSVVIVPVSCKGASTASVDIGITGGVYPYTFLWSNIATGFTSTNEDILSIPAGSYWLDISDASGCTITRSISVSEPASSLNTFVIDIDSVTCNGLSDGSVELQNSGGLTPYTNDWGVANPDSLSSGMYSYKVTDANGCEIIDSVFIHEPDPILIVPNVIDVDCPNKSTGSISILISGAISSLSTIDWIGPVDPVSNQPFVGSGLSINNLMAGDYTCMVTNENGCVSQLDVSVSEPDQDAGYEIWKQSKYSGYGVSCNGGSDGWIKIDYLDGTYGPYSFFWDNGDANDSIYGLSAGAYEVIITDAINCSDTLVYVLNEPDSVISFTSSQSDLNGYNVTCYGSNDGYIKVSALGGVGNYSYKWYKNDTLVFSFIQDSIYNLEAANYYVTVTDGNDCSVSDTINIVQPDSVYFTLKTATDTCGLQKGYAEVVPFGGAMGYQYLWSTGDLLHYVDTLSEGRYGVSIHDANFCESSQSFDISNLPSPIADFALNPSYQKLVVQFENPFVFIDNSETFSQSIDKWTWELSNNGVLLSVLTDSISMYSFDAVGDYVALLTIQTEFNCIDTISKKLKVDNYSLWIPTAFYPNSEYDVNQVFKPEGEGVKQFRMKIYSRWGGLVFESDDIQYGWDGLDNLQGVYTYYIEIVNVFDEFYTYEGVLNLIR